ncbi:MAG: hypothetical protein K2N31_01750 [Treponemataceae bacterium]|nr:hypothetical protein [Treponemataceae bacterium]
MTEISISADSTESPTVAVTVIVAVPSATGVTVAFDGSSESAATAATALSLEYYV